MAYEYSKRAKVNTRLQEMLSKVVKTVAQDDLSDDEDDDDSLSSVSEPRHFSWAASTAWTIGPTVNRSRYTEMIRFCTDKPAVYELILKDAKECGFEDRRELECAIDECSTIPSRLPSGSKEYFVAVIKSQLQVGKQRATGWKGLVIVLAVSLGVLATVALIRQVVRFVREYSSSMVDALEVEEQGPQYDNSKKQPHVSRTAATASSYKCATRVEADDWEENDKYLSVKKNILRMRYTVPGKVDRLMWVLMVDNVTVLVPNHFLKKFFKEPDPEKQMYLESVIRKTGVSVGWMAVAVTPTNVATLSDTGFYGGERDLAVVKLIDHTLGVRSIRDIIMLDADRVKMRESVQQAWWFDRNMIDKAVCSFASQIENYDGEVSMVGKTAELSDLGNCGRVYMLRNRTVQRPIVGLHVWGRVDREGIEQKLTGVADFSLEMIYRAEELIAERVYIPETIDPWFIEAESGVLVEEQEEEEWFDAETDMVGLVKWNDVPLTRHQPRKSVFTPSGLAHPKWKDEFAPAKIGVVNGVHTLKTNSQKFHVVADTTVSPGMMNRVVDYMVARIPVTDKPELTMEEMINGLPGLSPLCLETSPGFLSRYYKEGKKELFEALPQQIGEPIKYVLSTTARERVMDHNQKTFEEHLIAEDVRITEGSAPHCLWIAVNKDELLKRDKVARGKVRVFIAPELTYTLLLRKHFGHFIAWYKSQAGFRLCHGIGNDKDEVWKEYWKRLNEVGDHGFDCDYSNFDGTVTDQGISVVGHLADQYYGRRNRKARWALLFGLVHSYVIVDQVVIQTHQGNKSGNPATDVFNSIVNWFNMVVAFCCCQVHKCIPVSVGDFAKSVRCITYGDDVIVSASVETLTWYNRETVAAILSLLGYKITAANKTGKMVPSERLSSLTFLKSPWVEKKGYYLSPLPMEVIYRDLMWTRRVNLGDQTVMMMKVSAALRMAFQHGREVHEKLVKQLVKIGWPADKHVEANWETLWRELIGKQDVAAVRGAEDAIMLIEWGESEVQWTDIGNWPEFDD